MPTTDLLVSWGRPPPRWWRVKDPEEVEEVWSAGWETMAAAAAATECDSDRDRDRDWRLVFARARPGMVAGLSKRVGQECRLGSKKKKKKSNSVGGGLLKAKAWLGEKRCQTKDWLLSKSRFARSDGPSM